jgi:selenocysteine lyase/cysteine desulfurase
MPPYHGGGEMIDYVGTDGSTYKKPPHRFEAGTPNVGGAIALAAAADYLDGIGHDALWSHEQELVRYGIDRLGSVDGVHVFGPTDPASASPSSRSRSTACTRTTSRRSSMPRASPSAPATTAASR